MPVLIAFGSIEGHTGKIAKYVASVATSGGSEVVCFDTSDRLSQIDVTKFDRIILAASVHERRHPKDFEVFAKSNSRALAETPTLLLSVSLSAAFEDGHEEARAYADEMKMRTDLSPTDELLVAGAIKSSKYDFFATQVLKYVVLRGRDYDPLATEHEFTNWDQLAAKVRSFLAT